MKEEEKVIEKFVEKLWQEISTWSPAGQQMFLDEISKKSVDYRMEMAEYHKKKHTEFMESLKNQGPY